MDRTVAHAAAERRANHSSPGAVLGAEGAKCSAPKMLMSMAVATEFINVIIPVRALEERYPGGVAAYERFCSSSAFWRDEHLTRMGFMAPADAKEFVEEMAASSSLTLLDGDGVTCADIAVVDGIFGPTRPCPWLEFELADDGQARCWLSGTDPGELAIPHP